MLVLCSDEENTIQAIKWNLRDACQSSMGDEATILGLRHRTFMVQDLQQLSIFFLIGMHSIQSHGLNQK